MLYKNEDAFSKAQKEGVGFRAYLLYGSENYLIERWTGRLTGGGDAFNLHRFDGKKPDLEAIYEAVEALPLMAREKHILIDDLEWGKLPAADQKQLGQILSDIPEDCTIVVTAKAPAFDQKSAGGKKLIALFDKAGCAVELGQRTQSGRVEFLKREAKKQGCVLSTDLAKYMLELCEPDMLSLSGEIAKVCAYAGEGELAKSHVDAVAIPKTEAKVFDLKGAILSGDAAKALTLLDDLFYLRESPVAVLGVLSRAFVDLYRARIARDNGVSQQDVAARFGYKGREFLVRNAFSGSANLSTAYLRQALDALYACDRALKSTGVDDRVLLEETVIQLFVLKQQAS